MNDATMAGGDSATGGARILGIVRKFRAAGMEQPVAEAVGEELAHLPTRAEIREDIDRSIELALAKAMKDMYQKMVILVLAANGLTVALITLLK